MNGTLCLSLIGVLKYYCETESSVHSCVWWTCRTLVLRSLHLNWSVLGSKDIISRELQDCLGSCEVLEHCERGKRDTWQYGCSESGMERRGRREECCDFYQRKILILLCYFPWTVSLWRWIYFFHVYIYIYFFIHCIQCMVWNPISHSCTVMYSNWYQLKVCHYSQTFVLVFIHTYMHRQVQELFYCV